MRIVNAALWEDGVKNNQDAYGAQIYIFAKKWAELMESKMDGGEKLEDVAKDTGHEANDTGITGFMYGCAVNVLVDCWEHGEQLRLWHNLDTQL